MRHKSEVVGARGGFIYKPDEDENVQAADTALPRSQRRRGKGAAAAPCPLVEQSFVKSFAPTGEGSRNLGHDSSART